MIDTFILTNFRDQIKTKPEIEGAAVKVWRIKQDEVIRINMVEMSGELKMHVHPDAVHSLMVIEGRVRAQVGESFHVLERGDFLSIPRGIPHKYWSLEPKSYLVSMDAPYYDPSKTVLLER